MPMIKCRYFNGYKPCGKSELCNETCAHLSLPTARVLVIHLEAIGAVVRSTALLAPIRRKFPGCHITWVTQKPCDQILLHHPLIDRILTTSPDDLLSLSVLEFDVAFAVDKSLKAAGVLKKTKADLVFGFQVEPASGSIVPASIESEELWQIGLSDRKKFFENRKTETQLIHEALALGEWRRDPYHVELSVEEKKLRDRRRREWAADGRLIVGVNTGCSSTIPYKKLSIEKQRELVAYLQRKYRVVLLGGREDTLRNQQIAYGLTGTVQSSTDRGLRDGMISVAACDIVVSGDSLGMHLAIAFGKWTVAWFGPTCAHEIDFYDRGMPVLTQARCSPCWKRQCDRSVMCYDLVSVEELMAGVRAGEEYLKRESEFCQHQDEMKF